MRYRFLPLLAPLGVALAAALGACSTPIPPLVDVPGMANPELALQQSFQHVEAEMGQLGTLRTGALQGQLPEVVPGELDKVVSFAWEGSLDGAVEKLAKEIGYAVEVKAPFNGKPLSIGISTGPQRVVDIFEAIGGAAGGNATVEVDPQHQRVQVIHHV
jgi:defect-in-organelle-trafficking protein DotD